MKFIEADTLNLPLSWKLFPFTEWLLLISGVSPAGVPSPTGVPSITVSPVSGVSSTTYADDIQVLQTGESLIKLKVDYLNSIGLSPYFPC